MKQQIHPKIFAAKVKCVCGEEYEVKATKPEILTEICSRCSPVFTGQEEKKVIIGQVEKFLRRQKKKS
ncbi:MAG: 50S ribosomal protein L31 [Candidatus Parcubacteria bacterium]|nr:MAG: 50S ribosomal protein L31 [Candidatus Parcubacteria bacterium]